MTARHVPTGDVPAGGHLREEDAVLVALGEDLPAAAAHLLSCSRCSVEVERWRSIVDVARTEQDVQLVPPPTGTWEAIAATTGIRPTALETPETPPVLRSVTAAPSRRLPRWVALAAALVVGAVGGVLGTRLLDDPSNPAPNPAPPNPTVVFSAVLDPLDGNGSGSVDVVDADGHREVRLRVNGVAPAAGGILEVWLLDADGGLVSLGTLSGDDLTVRLPDDVDLDRFSTVDVSREPLDGNPAHSSDSVLRGSLKGA